jgi:hypothetical protein
MRRGAGEGPPDLTLRCDASTAASLARGTLAVPAAVLSGRLSTSGDVSRLVAATEALEAAAEAVRRVGALVDWTECDA